MYDTTIKSQYNIKRSLTRVDRVDQLDRRKLIFSKTAEKGTGLLHVPSPPDIPPSSAQFTNCIQSTIC